MSPTKALGVALIAGSVAVSSAWALGGVLRREAARSSRQQPISEAWFEARMPTSPQAVTRGRTLFLDSCAHCHGADAHGDEGPDLHDLQVSDRYIHRLIAHGIPHEMPSFAKKHDAADIAALTAYLRSLE